MNELAKNASKTIVITGGCGFIGSAVVRLLLNETDFKIVNVDSITYAATPNAGGINSESDRYKFVRADIVDSERMRGIFSKYQPDAIMNLAAETHVDRSIDEPTIFFRSNLEGVFNLLELAREYTKERPNFRFHHVSTDEVFGSLGNDADAFTELTRYDPSSPYSATKAAADHLVRAWGKTYGLDVVLTNCSNNYGPYQFPEKLIPLMILNAISGKSLPIYGDGQQVREWLYVDDHARALVQVLTQGQSGESYNIGSGQEKSNIDVVVKICNILAKYTSPSFGEKTFDNLITHVPDRPAHDQRYAIDSTKIRSSLGWAPRETFDSGLEKTVLWYLENEDWWRPLSSRYRQQRLGVIR